MSFYETQFPPAISFGASGGPGYLTNIVEVQSGYEYRDVIWSKARGRWDVAVNATNETNVAAILAFFRSMRGRAHGFRFKDWTDYQVTSTTGKFTTLTATTFQCIKRYTSGSQTEDRIITKPVSTIAVTGGTGVSVDYTTGIVTVASGTPTAWVGDFDVPVRFDTDRLEAEIIDGKTGNRIIGFHSVPVIELRI